MRLALAPVKALLATAVEEGLIRANPAAGLRLAQTVTSHDGDDGERVKALTEAELRCLLGELPERWRLFFEFLAHTGLRIGEAIALTWADIDFGRRRVRVRRRYFRGTFAPPKSRYGRRQIPLSKGIARAMATAWEAKGRPDGDALVFPSETGTPLDASNLLARVLKKAGRKAGVPWVGFHTFRHTCATMLFRSGLNAKQVQVWLGHHSPAFTLGTYVHLLSDDLPDAGFLDGLTGPGGNPGATSPTETNRDVPDTPDTEKPSEQANRLVQARAA